VPAASPALSRPPSYAVNGSSTPAASAYVPSGGGLTALDALKNKLAGFKSDLASKDSQLVSLRTQLSNTQLELAAQSSRAKEQLAAQKGEYEHLLQSSQNFVEKILHEKQSLNAQVSSLASQLESLTSDFAKKEAEFRSSTLAREVAKAKEAWVAAEKAARESFLTHRAKQIKAETLASVEGEVAKLLARANAERKDAEEALARKHAASLADARADHDALLSSVRKQHQTAVEHAREEERVLSQRKVREAVERYDALMQEQRARHQAELESERARLSASSATMQAAVESALTAQRQEQLVAGETCHRERELGRTDAGQARPRRRRARRGRKDCAGEVARGGDPDAGRAPHRRDGEADQGGRQGV